MDRWHHTERQDRLASASVPGRERRAKPAFPDQIDTMCLGPGMQTYGVDAIMHLTRSAERDASRARRIAIVTRSPRGSSGVAPTSRSPRDQGEMAAVEDRLATLCP
jgi:hypothetical protein